MILWLLLGLLLLPTLFAVLARVIARRGSARGATAVAAIGFAGCIACLVALRWLPLENQALGPLRILLPSSEIVVAEEAFLDLPAAEAGSDQVSNEGALPAAAAQPSPAVQPAATATSEPAATATSEPAATATSEPTAAPTPLPEPTAAPTPLPEPTAEPARGSALTSRPKPTVEPQPADEPATRAEPERYVVEPGDTLGEIAALYDVDPAELQQYNGLSDAEADSLQIGQVLFIPPGL